MRRLNVDRGWVCCWRVEAQADGSTRKRGEKFEGGRQRGGANPFRVQAAHVMSVMMGSEGYRSRKRHCGKWASHSISSQETARMPRIINNAGQP